MYSLCCKFSVEKTFKNWKKKSQYTSKQKLCTMLECKTNNSLEHVRSKNICSNVFSPVISGIFIGL